ncbi:hypothetical protein OROHE_003131 [Orobanche hederae]
MVFGKNRAAATSQEDADGEQSKQQFEEAFVDLVEEENNQNDGSRSQKKTQQNVKQSQGGTKQ